MRHPLDEAREQRFLIVEMVVDQPLADARGVRDVLHAQVRGSAGDDASRRRVKDPLRRG